MGDARRAVAKPCEGRVSAGLISCDQDDPSAQFQIGVGTIPEGNKLGLVAREIDDRDLPNTNLVFTRLRDRNLSVATAVFAECIIGRLEAIIVSKDANSGRRP